ncbi:MAG TPA: sulfotransferase [Caulobacteraceae bacterium]|nr:sulfotransferase [Caulobacteraceae bacterium]
MDNTADILREVAAAIRAPDLDRAVRLAETALAAGREHALLLNLRAWRLERDGRYAEALADLKHARALAPRDVPTLNALGLCLARLDRTGEAVEAFEAAVAADPNFAPAHFNRGWASEALGDLDQARLSLERAHALNPNDAAPLAHLASLAARRADWASARAYAEQSLAIDTGQPTAGLALAAAELATEAAGAAEQRLRELLALDSLSPIDRALAHGQLGEVFDAQDRPAEAFAEFTAANETLRRLYADRFTGPGPENLPATLAWLLAYFETAPQRARPPSSSSYKAPAAGHVFLVGFPRSGTTLLERVLGAHPDVVAWDERETLTEAVRDFMADPGGLDRLAAASDAVLNDHRAHYWRRVAASGAKVAGKTALDKLPLNTMKLPLIAKLFPDAKVLFARRDPRDVVLSCFRQRFRMNASMYEFLTLSGAARFYDGVMRLAELYRARLDLDVHTHRYEDLVEDFDGQTRAICAFIGLDWRPEMRAFADTLDARSIATPSSAQVARGLYRGGVGQWRRYRAQLEPVLPILAPWTARFGYDET